MKTAFKILIVLAIAVGLPLLFFVPMLDMTPSRVISHPDARVRMTESSVSASAGERLLATAGAPQVTQQFEDAGTGVNVVSGPQSAARYFFEIIQRESLRRGQGPTRDIVVRADLNGLGRKHMNSLRIYQKALTKRLERRDYRSSHSAAFGENSLAFELKFERSRADDQLICLESSQDGRRWGAIIRRDEEADGQSDELAFSVHHSTYSIERRVRFMAPYSIGRDAAAELALETLARRLRTMAFDIAQSSGWLETEDELAFREMLDKQLGTDGIIALGRVQLHPSSTDASPVFVEREEQEIWRNEVLWVGDQHRLRKVAESAAHQLRMRSFAPWIGLGLSLAVAILGILLWYRIDWWLKGHWGWTSRVAVALLTVLVAILIYQVPTEIIPGIQG